MKNIRNVTRSLADLNVALGTTFDSRYWRLVFSKIGYQEIALDPEAHTVTYPDFIPMEDMVRDVLDRLDSEQTAVCVVCGGWFDLNDEDGIFGDPERLERFLCRACSESTSARDFYYKHLRTRG